MINIYLNKHEQGTNNQDEDESEDNDGSNDDEDDENGLHQDVTSEYRRIITIHAGKPKGRTRDALKVDPHKVRRLSLSEQKLEKAAESYASELVR